MLTDIFARRYEKVSIWETLDEKTRRLLVQGFQLLEQIFPYYIGGQESDRGKQTWKNVHALLARELGLKELSPLSWGYWTPQNHWISGTNTMNQVCEAWMLKPFDGTTSADDFIKERISLIEIGFRIRSVEVSAENAGLPKKIADAKAFDRERSSRKGGMFVPGNRIDGIKSMNATMNSQFQAAIDELNARFRHAACNLNYHNGFIQIENDELVTDEVTIPFWRLLADPKFNNIDHDMKEAIDLRDTGGRDPAFYAARALESAIKIISDEKQLSTGKERGAANYIDNLKRGNLIENWEANALKNFFAEVRNPLGHGAGGGVLASLDAHQTDWAIEACMSWTKSLIRRT